MRLGIDASNIRAGGGLTHLREILAALTPSASGIDQVRVWGGQRTLSMLPVRPWLTLEHVTDLDRGLSWRVRWQRFRLDRLARTAADVLFIPGGTFGGDFRPFVTMSQNLLPFDAPERERFGLSAVGLRLRLLEHLQARTFRRAHGVVFLTQHARAVTESRLGALRREAAIIPHGITPRFFRVPRPARAVASCSPEDPVRLVYVSIVDLYKHQWHVVDAVARLRREGFPVQLDLIGRAYPPALRRLERAIAAFDPNGRFVRYRGAMPYESIQQAYTEADLFVFASTCETFGMTVLEAMASGLPIACAQRSAMPEVLGDAGRYFNPEDPADIAQCLKALILDADLRGRLAAQAYERAHQFTWEKCARDTFGFIAEAAARH